MLNYTENAKDAKDFILYYIKKDDKIIVYYASCDVKEFINTRDVELLILEKMKNQVLNSNVVYDKKGIISIGLLINNLFLLLSLNTKGLTSLISSIIALFLAIKVLLMNIDFSEKRSDYSKNIYFLNNEDLFNCFDRKNELLLLDISKKTKKIISSIPEGDLVFTINTIDKMKYNDLKKILYNMYIFDVSKEISRTR